MEKKDTASTSVKQLLLTRSNEGLHIYGDPFIGSSMPRLHEIPAVCCCALSSDTSLAAYSDTTQIVVRRTSDFSAAPVLTIPEKYIQELKFSPANQYLLAYAKHNASKLSQFMLFKLKDGSNVLSGAWKRSEEMSLFAKFSDARSLDKYFLLSPSKMELYIYACSSGFTSPVLSVTGNEIASAHFIPSDATFSNLTYVEKSPAKDGVAHFVGLEAKPAITNEVIFKKLSQQPLDSITIIPSEDGYAALYLGETLEDPTGKSYYGINTLHYRQFVGGSKRCKVTTAGDQICEAKWSPNSSVFVLSTL